ncbi:MAG TPA: NAD-binding protein [Acidimicrobiia bacterium]|nr:NAD-binding protein [Acidimicrobiia bacterium]
MACIGTLWYILIEGWSFVDSLEQTVTTVTTVGLGQVRPFDTSAKYFSVVLSIVGVSVALFTLGAVFEEQLEDSLDRYGRRKMDRRIAKISDHVIVCGYGRVGTYIGKSLDAADTEVVIVDASDDALTQAAESGHAIVHGSCTEDEVLLQAGIERARTMIVAVGDDAVAMSTALSARALNPKLLIIARANDISSEAKLVRAGCDRVVNPLSQGAHRMAAFAQTPDVADFLDVVVHDADVEYRLEEYQIPPTCELAGKTLGEAHIRRVSGALVLALRDPDGSFRSNPPPESVLEPGTTLIAIGTSDQLEEMETLLDPEGA